MNQNTLKFSFYSKRENRNTEGDCRPGDFLGGAEGGREGGPGEESRLQAGEEGEDVVSRREGEVRMLDTVNTNTHQAATASRLLKHSDIIAEDRKIFRLFRLCLRWNYILHLIDHISLSAQLVRGAIDTEKL